LSGGDRELRFFLLRRRRQVEIESLCAVKAYAVSVGGVRSFNCFNLGRATLRTVTKESSLD
jgi:hypothetical protein